MLQRNRFVYVLLLLLTMGLGLASRRYAVALPVWVGAYAGDALWALLVFWLVGLGWPRWSSWRVVGVAAGFALAIELSQLCHTPWLMQLRATRLGALVLGHGFLWSDLACYGVGILAGVGLEGLVGKRKRQPPSLPPSMEAEN